MEGNSTLTATQGVALMMRQQATARLSGDSQVVANGNNPAISSFTANRGTTQIYLEDRATVVGNVAADGSIYISDQARITGRLSEQDGNVALSMSGGSIGGGVNLRSAGDYAASITGVADHGPGRDVWCPAAVGAPDRASRYNNTASRCV